MVRKFLTSSPLAASLLVPLTTQTLGIDVIVRGKVMTFVDVSNAG